MGISAKNFINQFILPLWNEKTLEVIDTFISPGADIRTTLLTGLGPTALKDNAKKIFQAFSTFELSIKEAIQKGKYIIYRWTGKGIHSGEVFNVQPTGQKITFSEIMLGVTQGEWITSYHSFSNIPQVLCAASIPAENKPERYLCNIEHTISKIKDYTGKKLTKREIECLKLWLQGFSIKETAKRLGNLSCRTIQTFRENIKRKLNVETYQQLFNLIYYNGMMPFFLTHN